MRRNGFKNSTHGRTAKCKTGVSILVVSYGTNNGSVSPLPCLPPTETGVSISKLLIAFPIMSLQPPAPRWGS
eukprot:scaffold99663_cov24-Attheya_sp.AAC.1